jgi:hypothetical protein
MKGSRISGWTNPITGGTCRRKDETSASSLLLIPAFIDNEDFFIRGVIEIRVHEYPEVFGVGVWVSQKRENFYKYLENFNSADIGPFFGWLCNRINYYAEDTRLLKTFAYFRKGLRPSIVLEETDHPLSIDQRDGITLDKAWEIAHFYTQVPS